MAFASLARSLTCPSLPNQQTHHHPHSQSHRGLTSSQPSPRSQLPTRERHNAMDALVYEDTPLATYFEGEAVPFDLPDEITPPHTPFAPKGLPSINRHVKKTKKRRLSIAPTSTKELVERFRYVIVASQLLTEDAGRRPATSENDLAQLDATSVSGVIVTAVLSFVAAWALHWLRTRRTTFKITSWLVLGIYGCGIVVLVMVVAFLLQRSYVQHLQKSAVRRLSAFVDQSHSFDATASSSIRFIQEVEIVARGYNLTTPLPPISRIEDRQAIRRCRSLRGVLAHAVKALTVLLVQTHNAIQPLISKVDLQRYHDIYEVSLVEYSQAIELANETSEEAEDSLKDLRFAIRLQALARKVFLCDLLALRQTKDVEGLRQWTGVLRIVREIESQTRATHEHLAQTLSLEEWGSDQKESRRSSISDLSQATTDNSVSENQTLKSQSRRFDEVANCVRALNAKVHVLKEEINGLMTANTADSVISTSMQKHYESLGVDIRNLMVEWEKGRNTMLLNLDTEQASVTQYSRSSSSIRSPISPSPSLGNGVMIVDGGPAEALRLLNGDFDPHASLTPIRKSLGIDIPDEEIFEAMSKPPARGNKRMSVSGMSREQKMAKLQEDRRKRATLQEQADNTTNMLRELRMVIKHRPRASVSGPTSRPGMTPPSESSDDGACSQKVPSL